MDPWSNPVSSNGIYDPFSPEVIDDPYPFYRRLLRDSRVHHEEEHDLWVLTRYDDVHRALRDHRALSSAEGVAFQRMGLPMMLTLDPPDHTRLRRIVSREFTPRNLERWRSIVERLAHDAVGRILEREGADFVEEVAAPLPLGVIAGMLGLPADDLPELRQISDDIVEGFKMSRQYSLVARQLTGFLANGSVVEWFTLSGMRFPGPTGAVIRSLARFARNAEGATLWGGDIERSVAAVSRLQAYCGVLVRERRRYPGDDLVSQLLRPHDDGALSEAEVFWFFLLLLLAGHETTTNLLGNLLLALIANPDQWLALRTDASLVPSAVNEALRFESPIQGFFRTAKNPYRVGEIEIPKAGASSSSSRRRIAIPTIIPTPTRFSSAATRPITWDSAAASTPASEPPSPRWRDAPSSRKSSRARASLPSLAGSSVRRTPRSGA